MLGFCRLRRVRPQRLREWRSEAHPQSDRRSTMSRCSRRQPTASWSSCSSDRGGLRVKVVYTEPGRRNLAAVSHGIAPVPATYMTHRVVSDVRDASRRACHGDGIARASRAERSGSFRSIDSASLVHRHRASAVHKHFLTKILRCGQPNPVHRVRATRDRTICHGARPPRHARTSPFAFRIP